MAIDLDGEMNENNKVLRYNLNSLCISIFSENNRRYAGVLKEAQEGTCGDDRMLPSLAGRCWKLFLRTPCKRNFQKLADIHGRAICEIITFCFFII